MKKSLLYIGLLLTIVFAMTTTTVLANSDSSLKSKKTPFASETDVTSTMGTPAPRGNSEQHRNNSEIKNGNSGNANLRGTVLSSDATSLTLELKNGSQQVITMDANTVIQYPTHFEPENSATPTPEASPTDDTATETVTATEMATATATPSALDGLQVMVKSARQADGSFLALRVMVIPGKPEKQQHVGLVTAYTADSSITLKGKDGLEYTFSLSSSTRILPEGSTIKVGDSVTVIMPRVLIGQPKVAAGIVLHGVGNVSESESGS